VAAVLAVSRHFLQVFRLAAALVLELATFLTTNYAVARPRPHVPHVGSTPSTFSWPSGHTAATLALYGGIALIVAATTRNRVATAAAWVFAAAMVVCVALSRVYRGEHHPTDTLAGIVIGAAVLWISSRALRAWQGGRRPAAPARRRA
jgi:undecaprenyl-diphosphatase